MAKLPTVAIIGKPNTGKSTLFNRFIGQRKAIESDIAGTTRDHIAHKVETDQVDYILLDTGGMGTGTEDKEFEEDVYEQSLLALQFADVIILLMNGNSDMTTDDHRIIDVLRKRKRRHVPIILVLSKMDNPREADDAKNPYYALGLTDDIIALSSFHRMGFGELQKSIEDKLLALHFAKEEKPTEEEKKAPRIAIIGKPNVGKSSLINAMMADPQRDKSPLLVSDIAGTTRDATDTFITYEGRPYVLVDTAGIRRQSKTEKEVERFAMMRTITALESSDIAVLVLDATENMSQQDKRIASLCVDSGKGFIILLNKIDLLNTEKRKEKIDEVEFALRFCKFGKILPCSAKTRVGIVKLFDTVDAVQRNLVRHIPMRELKRWLDRVVYGQPLGEISRCKYITQANEVPPTFVLFVKNPKQVGVTQLRFLDNRIRETFGFEGAPIRWITKTTENEDRKKKRKIK